MKCPMEGKAIPLSISILASAVGSRVTNPTPLESIVLATAFIGGLIAYQIIEIRDVGKTKMIE